MCVVDWCRMFKRICELGHVFVAVALVGADQGKKASAGVAFVSPDCKLGESLFTGNSYEIFAIVGFLIVHDEQFSEFICPHFFKPVLCLAIFRDWVRFVWFCAYFRSHFDCFPLKKPKTQVCVNLVPQRIVLVPTKIFEKH